MKNVAITEICTRTVLFSPALRLFSMLLGGILLVSGVGKLLDSTTSEQLFREIVAGFRNPIPFTPETLMKLLSLAEITLALLFLSGNYLALAISLTSFMIGGFTAGLLLSMDTITLPTCGCSGLFDFGMPLEMAIVRNCILLVLLSIMRSLLNKQTPQMQIQKV